MPNNKKKHHLEDDAVEVEPSPKFAMPVYLVVEHGVKDPAFSVFKVDAAADGGEPVSRAHHLSRLHFSAHGMSFVAANSQHGSWIVGVGGVRGSTVIFDPNQSKEIRGRVLGAPKLQPVLIAIGGKVYAIARRPFIVPGINFEPWFEVLDLNERNPFVGRGAINWRELSPPPFFPCYITPLEFLDPPPQVSVMSYAVVGSHILLSLRQEKGTYAFDVETEKWELVDDRNLPFDGQALPIGNDRFVSLPKTGAASAAIYDIKVYRSSGAEQRELSTKLSVLEFLMPTELIIPAQLMCPLVHGNFCAFSLSSSVRNPLNNLERAKFVQCTLQIDDKASVLTAKKQQMRTYKLFDRSRQLARPTPLAAALTLGME